MSENVPLSDIDPRKLELAELHAMGATADALSAELGVTKRTVHRWLQDPDVKRVIHEIRAASVSAASVRLQDGLARAAEVLRALVESERESTRLAAVRLQYDVALKMRAFDEYAERLARLERAEEARAGKAVLA